MRYGDKELGQHWPRWWLVAWRHQVITFKNQCLLIISETLWHSPEVNFTGHAQDIISILEMNLKITNSYDDVIKWKHFPRYWPFVRGIHRSPVNSPHKGQWRGALMVSLICAWMNGWVNNREAGDLRRHRAHYDVIVMRLQPNLSGANEFTCQYSWVLWQPINWSQQRHENP